MPVVLADGISRSEIMLFLRSRGIQTSIHYPPVHQFSCYRGLSQDTSLERTEELGRRVLTLPLFPDLTYEQVKLVCDSFQEAIECAGGGIAED
jgi:dTDP-4-amino-4,6-dideoxygalactose transaminase